jgi:hypothetical protein
MVLCGEFVVDCVAKMVREWSLFRGRKVGHLFELYFWVGSLRRPDYCWEAGEAVELGVDPLGLGRRTRNAAMATTMMPMMMKTMSGLGKHVLLPGGLGGEAMDCWMRELGLRFFGGGPSGLGRHPLFYETRRGVVVFCGSVRRAIG